MYVEWMNVQRSGDSDGHLVTLLFTNARDTPNCAIFVNDQNRFGQYRGSATRPSVEHDSSVFDEFTSPHAPGLFTFERTIQTRGRQGTTSTDCLSASYVDVLVTEEEGSQSAVAISAASRLLHWSKGNELVDLDCLKVNGGFKDHGHGVLNFSV
jgi:hypothetical protein